MVLREHQPQIDDATKSRKRVETEIKARNSNVFPRFTFYKSLLQFELFFIFCDYRQNYQFFTLFRRERSIRHPKSEQLSDRWKKLWIDSMDYGRRLREMKEYLDEVIVQSFSSFFIFHLNDFNNDKK